MLEGRFIFTGLHKGVSKSGKEFVLVKLLSGSGDTVSLFTSLPASYFEGKQTMKEYKVKIMLKSYQGKADLEVIGLE